MPYAVDEEYEHSESNFVLVDEGIYPAFIFEVAKKEKDKEGEKQRWYDIAFRIDGGEFDGEDVRETYVGLKGKSLFKLYQILDALGEIDNYYDREQKRWHHIPAPEDLEGKKVYVKVEHEAFQARDRDTQQLKVNEDGSPRMLNSAKPTFFYNANEPKPEFKPTRRNPGTPASGGVSPAQAAANVAAGGGTPVQEEPSGEAAW